MARLKYKDQFQEKKLITYFGEITLDPQKVIYFPNAILGFANLYNYCISTIPDNKIPGSLILQSLDNEKIAFIITPLGEAIFSGPDAVMNYDDILQGAKLYNIEGENLSVVAITKISKDGDNLQITANLMAPILIDKQEKVGYQHVLLRNDYPLDYIIKR